MKFSHLVIVAAIFAAIFAATACSSPEATSGTKSLAQGPGVDAATAGCTGPADCDDGNACTDDGCDKTKGCTHVATVCDDSDACTEDACDKKKGCTHDTTDCNDSDACTADTCDKKKGCAHSATDCDDSDACTADTCDKVKGTCKHAATDCDDGDACTADTCDKVSAKCKHTATDCDDNDACTEDTCDKLSSKCKHAPAVDCDDSDACTKDSCDPVSGKCKHTATPCDDGVTCTDDGCDKAKGCTITANNAACDDNIACTKDVCDKAKDCSNTPSKLACDDNNACTDDVCDKVNDCTHTSKIAGCDDGNECTIDTCDKTAGCKNVASTGAACTGSGTCDAAGTCTKCVPKCESGKCTDGCGGLCAGACDDSNACTSGDACNSGACKGAVKDCADGNDCTKDSCDPASGCKQAPDNAPICNDGNPCTSGDKCANGTCSGGTATSCDDQNECTADSCDNTIGCKHAPKDGVACSGGGKCVQGGCCVPKCAGMQCGDDGCGGTCGSCGATSVCTAGSCTLLAQPKIEGVTPNTFNVGGDKIVPGYIAHLFGTKVGPDIENFATVQVKNPTSAPVSVVLTVDLQGFGQPSDTKVDLQAGESKTIPVNLTLNLPAIYALTTAAASNLKVSLSLAGQIVDTFTLPAPLKISTKNTVFWVIKDATGKTIPMHGFVAAMVTPKAAKVQALLTSAGYYSGFGAMIGYQALGKSLKFTYVVSPGQCAYAGSDYAAGQKVSVSVSISGGVSNNEKYYLLDTANYGAVKSGASANYIIGTSTAGASWTGSTTIGTEATYYHAMCNPNANWSNRTFTVTRTIGSDEAASDQMSAVFSALKAKNLIYTSVATDFFAGAQNVKTPTESLSTNSANCIDGALLFASALEALGMEPMVIIIPGHAYVAVAQYPGAKLENGRWMGLETTMVSSASADEAINKGTNKLYTDLINGNFTAIVDVAAVRKVGIVPGGY